MDAGVKKLWVEALRSGEYEQGKFRLERDGKFCCLGVLCKIALTHEVTDRVDNPDDGISYGLGPDGRANGYLPVEVMVWAHLPLEYSGVDIGEGVVVSGATYWSLTGLNDGGYTFPQIAALIEQRL